MSLSDGTLAPLFSELDALRRRIALYREPVWRLRLAMNRVQLFSRSESALPVNATLWDRFRRWTTNLDVETEIVVSIDPHQPFAAEASALRRILGTMADLDLSSIEACPVAGLVRTRNGQWRAVRLGSGTPLQFEPYSNGLTDLARGARILDDGSCVTLAYPEEALPRLSVHERLALENWRAAFRPYAPDEVDHCSHFRGKIEVARNGDLGYVIATDPISAKIVTVASLADASPSTMPPT